MSGIVVIAGVFQPDSVVTLHSVPDERVLRPEGHDVISQRLVDKDGNVGWEGLEVGARFLVTGYINGSHVIVRARAVDGEAPDTELIQPPVKPLPDVIGTQEAKPEPVTPAHPDGELEVGLPEGVKTSVLGAPGGPVEPEPEPAQAEQVAPDTEPSESAGVQEGAGAPSEQAEAAQDAATEGGAQASSEEPAPTPAADEAAPAAEQPPA